MEELSNATFEKWPEFSDRYELQNAERKHYDDSFVGQDPLDSLIEVESLYDDDQIEAEYILGIRED